MAGTPFNNSFGEAASLNVSGNYSYFSGPLPEPYIVLGEDGGFQPVVISHTLGAGLVILIGDVDLVSNNRLSPGADITNDNDRFLGNLFEYALTAAGLIID